MKYEDASVSKIRDGVPDEFLWRNVHTERQIRVRVSLF